MKTADMVMVKDKGDQLVISFNDIGKIEDRQYLQRLDSKLHQAYPQPIDLVETYRRLLNKESIEASPETKIPEFLTFSIGACHPYRPGQLKYHVIVLVQSTVPNFERRRKIREFYSRHMKVETYGIRYKFVFSLGFPRTQSRVKPNFFGSQLRWWFGVKDKRAEWKRLLREEILKYDDVVLGNYQDDFLNQTLQIHHTFAWASLFCRRIRPMFLIMDEYKLFDADNLARVINDISRDQRETLFYGEIIRNRKVYPGDSSIGIGSEIETPFVHFPDFPTHYGYTLVGFETLQKLTVGMYFTRYFTNAQMYLGLVAARMGLKPQDMSSLIEWKNLHLREVEQ
ncbi:hypothetical protein Aperf_G00000081761 [Anoplocephala perfoliata]